MGSILGTTLSLLAAAMICTRVSYVNVTPKGVHICTHYCSPPEYM